MYLSILVRQLIYWIFTTNIPSVSRRVSFFMGFNESESTPEAQFGPAMLFGLWCDQIRWPRAQKHLRTMTILCAHELALQDSNRLINNPELRIKMKTLTIHKLQTLLHPQKLIQVFKDLAPFMWQILHTFCASLNNHRRRQAAEIAVPVDDLGEDDPMPDVGSEDEEDWADDPNLESGEVDPDSVLSHWLQEYAGFARNPVFLIRNLQVILLCLSMLVFVRNCATNVLPLILGLFLKVSGTSTRVIQMLSNVGVCVSGDTIKQLKERVSEDTINLAVELITSRRVFFTIFDNINIFLRKSQQRLSNTNNMINATNCTIIGIDGVEPFTPTDLTEKLALRGNRARAKPADILPTPEDDEIIGSLRSFVALIAEMIVVYCPGNGLWHEHKEIAAGVTKMMPLDRPLPPEKTDGRPFGLFDVNEGLKKGVVKVLQSVQERSTLSQKIWSSISRIFVGNWLTSNNLRAARRDWTDDINAMERLEYADELSAPWHFALQATHMIMRTHYGQAVEDPASLAAHKGLLNRKWDVNKPNYVVAKSLIRHSLIAHILHCGVTTGWTLMLQDIQVIALVISNDFPTATAARKAQFTGDDWMAHSIYFIRDSLFFMLFEKAVSFGDAGQLIRVLKYWGLAFRGVGQHNYAHECTEVLVCWRYELTDKLRSALERSWFVNRFGKPGRFIPSDLYLEQLNFWIKRVYIASGAGVTVQYIIRKGSACVEAFRDISHLVANFFGDLDCARRSKEVKFYQDIEALISEMQHRKFNVINAKGHFVPAPPPKKTTKKAVTDDSPCSAIADIFVKGAEEWNGKFEEFIRTTTYDKELGYPLPTSMDKGSNTIPETGTAFDNTNNSLTFNSYADLHGDESESGTMGIGALGGGDEFYGVE
ncbi:hypothetical protein DFH08DRAFT_1005503 [Mycena albidolilacea]|uniref:DUF6589 domain-containing protein n=1 Tax=Mycena albidolilacea TaxID=1033008 RepID=A0AAD7F5B3_9AGAR|nr:hypothetical protein DFH08DRAFT_1005503 [Mycena albidolilacea]